MQTLRATNRIHAKIENDLKAQIGTGRLRPGDRILSERKLCGQYGLSRTAIRSVIEELIRDGLLCRDARRGTFVADSGTVRALAQPATRTVIVGFNPSLEVTSLRAMPRFEATYRGIESQALAHGYDVAIQLGAAFRQKLSFGAARLKTEVCGMIVGGVDIDAAIDDLLRAGVPLVILGPTTRQDVNAVDADAVSGGYLACRYVLEHGYERTAFVAPVFQGESGVQQGFLQRRTGYLRALGEAGVTASGPTVYPVIDTLTSCTEEGENQLREALQRLAPPFAVFTAADILAPTLYKLIGGLGLKIPDDVGIIGCDGQPWAETLDPPLTTVFVDTEHIGVLAWKRLHELITAPAPTPPFKQLVPVRLIERASCLGASSGRPKA
ncbi:MAG: GntR family transcriptional regulator [Kiritimatiellae bacterium]|nr:GntR family transcriptional regulator [Kiritimatiellia bacterium]